MRTEDALQLSEQKFEALFQGMPLPVYAWQCSGDDFVLVNHNAAADVITGGKIADFLGMSATAMYPDRPDIVADISGCFEEKSSIQREMVYWFKTSGERKDLVVDYVFVPPDLVLVQTQDVTQRVKAVEALLESETRLELAVAGSNGGLWSIALDPDDPTHTLPDEIYLSPRLKAMMGYEDGEFPNSLAAWESQVHPEDLPRLREASLQYRQGEMERHGLEYRMRHKDGSIRWLRTTGRVERDNDGRPVRFAGIDWDITELKEAVAEATYEQGLMRALLENMPDYVYFKDRDRRFVRASNAFCNLFKLELDAIIGKRDEELFPPEVAAETVGDDLRVIEMGIPLIDKEEGGDQIGGEPHWVLTTKLPWYDADGNIIGLFGISREITERVQAERSLRRERDLVSRVMETSPVGITVFDRQWRITFANALAQQEAALLVAPELRGLSYEDLSGQIMTVDGRPITDEEQPFLDVMSTGQSVYNARYAVEGQDGRRLFVSVNASPLFDEAGQIDGVIMTTDDITSRVQAQAQLQASEEKYRDLVERISDVIYAVDARGVITYLNPAIEALIGLSPEQLIGQPFTQFMHPEDLGRVQGNVQDLLSGVSPGPAEYRVLDESGETRWIQVTSQPIVDGGRVSGLQGVLTDITERKRLEEQLAEEAIAAERQRLARELHDSVSQTLYSASLIAQAVERMWERDPDECRRGLEQLQRFILGAVAEMRTLLLELHPASMEDQSLPILLRQLADAAMVRTPAIVTTTVMGKCTLPSEVKVAMYRIAQEALRNVVQYAGARRVQVNLQFATAHPDALDGMKTILSIRDDGSGFDREGTQPAGMGIGIMRDRAREIGATLSITSQLGQGTEVQVAWQNVEPKS
jgi:PAS domain S-box-containing protein